METMIDGKGVAYSEYRRKLPQRSADFPRAELRRKFEVLVAYRRKWDQCQMCGKPLREIWAGDVHHIIGGAGRSDEPSNLLRLCIGCHDESWSVILPAALYAKWQTDRKNLSWVRLAILYGRFLPQPKRSER